MKKKISEKDINRIYDEFEQGLKGQKRIEDNDYEILHSYEPFDNSDYGSMISMTRYKDIYFVHSGNPYVGNSKNEWKILAYATGYDGAIINAYNEECQALCEKEKEYLERRAEDLVEFEPVACEKEDSFEYLLKGRM